MKLSDVPFNFQRMLRLTESDGSNADGPIVRYEDYDTALGSMRCGVYLIVQDDEVVYCGKFTGTFARRWLYTKGKYVYHFKRGLISMALSEDRIIEVFAQDEPNLRKQLGHPDNEWISVTSIEEKLIRDLRPIWNSLGRGKDK